MAAMQIAKVLDAEIYATVGNADKVEILKHEFNIPEDHIFQFKITVRTLGNHGRD